MDAVVLAAVLELRVVLGQQRRPSSSGVTRATPCTDVIGIAKVDSPMRTRIACVTARVNGRRSTKVLPSPCSRFDRQRTAELLDLVGHHVHADAATGQLGDRAGGGEARLGDQRKQLVVGQAWFPDASGPLDAALADGFAIQTATIVADAHHHLGGFARHADMDGAFFGLPALRRSSAIRYRAPPRCAACVRTAP
jgi:hypothetical protein